MHKQGCKCQIPRKTLMRHSLSSSLFLWQHHRDSECVWSPLRACMYPDLYAKSCVHPIHPSAVMTVWCPLSSGLDFRGARQRVWPAAWQRPRVSAEGGGINPWFESGVLELVLGGYKGESGNCASLQLWAYVSIGRNALTPRLAPLPYSFSLISHSLSFLCSFAASNRLLTAPLLLLLCSNPSWTVLSFSLS